MRSRSENCIKRNHKTPVTKTPIITATAFSLEYCRIFSDLYISEHTGLITIENQLLEKKYYNSML